MFKYMLKILINKWKKKWENGKNNLTVFFTAFIEKQTNKLIETHFPILQFSLDKITKSIENESIKSHRVHGSISATWSRLLSGKVFWRFGGAFKRGKVTEAPVAGEPVWSYVANSVILKMSCLFNFNSSFGLLKYNTHSLSLRSL